MYAAGVTKSRVTASLCRMSRVLESSAVILVANKTDLVKSRVVKPADGKQVAVHYNIKYIETSPGGPHTGNNAIFSKMNNLYIIRNSTLSSKYKKIFSRHLPALYLYSSVDQKIELIPSCGWCQ